MNNTNILEQILRAKNKRIEQQKCLLPLQDIKSQISNIPSKKEHFIYSISKDDINLICEIKKASPSKGVIDLEFDYINIAKDYQKAGANAISVLCESDFFQGNVEYLASISKEISTPLLRKDFITDEYLIYEAKLKGASAVLLIERILDKDKLKYFLNLCDTLGLAALLEVDSIEGLNVAMELNARIIGVNNRDLRDFSVDISKSIELKKAMDSAKYDAIFVAESGIHSTQDIQKLKENGIRTALIGESIMKSKDKINKISELKNA